MMINTFEIENPGDITRVLALVRGSSVIPAEVLASVREIVDDVRLRGDQALLELTERLDGARLEVGGIEVTAGERKRAWDSLDGDAKSALEKAADRISSFARLGVTADVEMEISPGVRVGQYARPVDSAGLYVPGGRFPYPSTVLMTGLPAREAGVKNIAYCVPPDGDGSINPSTLAATVLVGDCRVFRAGGAQAIAAMAFGTRTVPRCMVVAGPGNIYVTAAKRLLAHVVSIDLEAGPSEVAVLADGSADLSFAAADMLAQLEHDPLSIAVLVSDSNDVLEEARGVLERMSESDDAGGAVSLVHCGARELAIAFLNALAPEHLELMVDDAASLVSDISAAGCVFVGPYSAVALGDYIAGPSHVLPTGGTASRLSGLGARNFTRTMNVVGYTREGFARDAGPAGVLAMLEGLEKHAISIDIRRSPDA